MVSWGVRARTWTAKSPEEQRLEYEAHRLEVGEGRLHNKIKTERRILKQVEAVAADGARDARIAQQDAMYGYGSPYHRVPYGGIHSPYVGNRNMIGHPGLPYVASPLALGVGISPHLDPAFTADNLHARREMAMAHHRQRRMLAQRQMLAQRPARAEMAAIGITPRMPAIAPRIIASLYMANSPYVGNLPYGRATPYAANMPYAGGAAYLPQTPYAAGMPFMGPSPYMAPYGIEPVVNQTPYMGGVAYDDRVDAPFGYDPTYHPLAGLNVPPGSVRLRRMSTPMLDPLEAGPY